MPTVCITGLNGYISTHTALVFLRNGWDVRGTVRSQAKADKVLNLPEYEKYKGQVTPFIVEDLATGDFSAALDGVDALCHPAAPWHLVGGSWEDYRVPAIKGTTNVIEQACKVPTIKAVSVLSAFGAICDLSRPFEELSGVVYDENSFMPLSEEEIATVTGERGPITWYCGGKKYGELAAREVVERLKPNFTLGVCNPPYILGPTVHWPSGNHTSPDIYSYDVTSSLMWTTLVGGKDSKIPWTDIPVYADSRNVSQALYEVIVRRKNGRYPLCNGHFDFQELANRARELYPDLAAKGIIPLGDPEDLPSSKGKYTLDGSLATKELGIQYIPKDQTIKDIIDYFAKIGAFKV